MIILINEDFCIKVVCFTKMYVIKISGQLVDNQLILTL